MTDHAAKLAESVQSLFEEWWERSGQFCRAGGGGYEKTFAFHAWEVAIRETIAAHRAQQEQAGAAGEVELPEPYAEQVIEYPGAAVNKTESLPLYTDAQLLYYGDQREAAALERAASACSKVYYEHIGPQYGEVRYGISACESAIRSLIKTSGG